MSFLLGLEINLRKTNKQAERSLRASCFDQLKESSGMENGQKIINLPIP
jgi:hypothetical protein